MGNPKEAKVFVNVGDCDCGSENHSNGEQVFKTVDNKFLSICLVEPTSGIAIAVLAPEKRNLTIEELMKVAVAADTLSNHVVQNMIRDCLSVNHQNN